MRTTLLVWMTAAATFAADLPIREVILYKHGVGFFERAGKLEAGDTARIDFKADDMNDVLKSLTITDRSGGKISGVRYDASEPLEERLKNFPFAVGVNSTLSVFLDQMKGARIELKFGSETLTGVIVSARVIKEKETEHETITLLTDSGEMRTFDLAGATSIKFTDAKLQGLLKDYLSVLNGARSKDRRSVYIDSVGTAARDLVASYMTPSPVWKSSYRLLFPQQGEPTLEGWAIVDNTSGDDWNSVRLSVVSGRPISFVTQLYAPKYVNRPGAELADNLAAAPTVFQGSINGALEAPYMRQMAKAAPAPARAGAGGIPSEKDALLYTAGAGQTMAEQMSLQQHSSTISSTAEGRDAGDLFEYSFSSPVTVKKGESAMLPFLQQKVGARKLLIYRESFGVNPQNASEVTNSTGKTLDGGPITVYDAGSYAGEALVETVKAGDKRLISYGVDLGTRITTKFDSSQHVVREIHCYHGNLTSKYAMEEVRTFTIKNVDPKAKTLLIEHPQRQGYKLLEPAKATETTPNANRFEVKLAASANDTFALREERVYDQTVSVSNMTPEMIGVWLENKVLSAAGRRQLEQIAAKKREIADNEAAIAETNGGINQLTQDQTRVRANIQSLNSVKNQQDLVQQYASQLAANETRMVALRDKQDELRRKKTALESELNTLMEKIDF
ncbi:MAG TPA: hypothetical protein VK752_08100 [Bryobacteraceae bacterium]|jgi:hypothetical protein|nr:hypothetical protein [Bryobacteraceae bacterium]